MEISLSSENEKFIQSQIANGIYKTINDAVNAAINMAINKITLSEERINEFNKEVEIGLNAYENGEIFDGNTVMAQIRKKYDL